MGAIDTVLLKNSHSLIKKKFVFFIMIMIMISFMIMVMIMFRFRLRNDYGFDFGYVILFRKNSIKFLNLKTKPRISGLSLPLDARLYGIFNLNQLDSLYN